MIEINVSMVADDESMININEINGWNELINDLNKSIGVWNQRINDWNQLIIDWNKWINVWNQFINDRK